MSEHYNAVMRRVEDRVRMEAKVLFNKESTLPDRVYHYTDTKGLLGILATGGLWASNSAFVNDAEEFSYAVELIKDCADSRSRDGGDRDHFFDELNEWLSRMLASGPYAFIACFCGADNLLSQWRAYGDRGGGVAIGFSAGALQSCLNKYTYLRGCFYDLDFQDELLSSCVETACRAYVAELRQSPPAERREALDASITGFYNAVAEIMLLFKSQAFSEENEARIVSLGSSKGLAGVEHRATRNAIIPYIEVNFLKKPEEPTRNRSNMPIREIMIGPSEHQGLLESSLRQLLLDLRYEDIEIRRSTTPFRTWPTA